MTCIAAYKDLLGNIWMGGDSLCLSGTNQYKNLNPKIFRRDNMIFGFSGYLRATQVLQYQFEIPQHDPRISDYEYLISVFLDEFIKKLEETNSIIIESNVALLNETDFLVGYNKKIFNIEQNFQLTEFSSNYDAIGCGAEYANAAFWMMENNKKIKPENRVVKALECSSNFSLVRPPFHIIKLDYNSGLNC